VATTYLCVMNEGNRPALTASTRDTNPDGGRYTHGAGVRSSSAGTSIRCRRWPDECGLTEVMMTGNRTPNGRFGAVLGGMIVAVALAFFLFIGGVGKKAVNSDNDLPPIAKGQQR
jgi:hypothetical protein